MTKGQRIIATIEARMTSSRLPGKVLMQAAGKPLLEVLLQRLRKTPGIDGIVVATTTNDTDDPIVALGDRMGVDVFRGSEDDVLGRVCGALRSAEADICVEITGDCPLIDPVIVQESIDAFLETSDTHPYVSNSDPHRSVPAGLDVQVFFAEALFELASNTDDPDDREHVSLGFYRPESTDTWNPRFITHESCVGAQDVLVTLDYAEDYELIRRLHEALVDDEPDYGARQIVDWIRRHPDLQAACRQCRTLEVTS